MRTKPHILIYLNFDIVSSKQFFLLGYLILDGILYWKTNCLVIYDVKVLEICSMLFIFSTVRYRVTDIV